MSRKSDPFTVDLTPELIIRAYQSGIFPMAEDAESPDLFWVSPPLRGIIPLDAAHISRSLRKTLRDHPYQIRVDTDFAATIEGCATSGTDRDSTWINAEIRRLYGALFDRGYVHTVEVWDGTDLVGGLYGVSIGAAFFGESMFHRSTDASKVCLLHLAARLRDSGYHLLDTQFVTPHLATLGAIEVPRARYKKRLAEAVRRPGRVEAWAKAPLPGAAVLDMLSPTR